VTDHATGCTREIWCIRPVLAGKVPRWGLGPSKGNAARLFWAPGPKLIVAEGVEDALAAHVQQDGLPAWAALNAENMKTLMLPPRIREVLIVADHDEPKRDGRRPGLEGAWALAKRLRAEGRSAEVRWTTSHKDPNELLLAQRRVAW
jgi:putative DNA primase/helicase